MDVLEYKSDHIKVMLLCEPWVHQFILLKELLLENDFLTDLNKKTFCNNKLLSLCFGNSWCWYCIKCKSLIEGRKWVQDNDFSTWSNERVPFIDMARRFFNNKTWKMKINWQISQLQQNKPIISSQTWVLIEPESGLDEALETISLRGSDTWQCRTHRCHTCPKYGKE